MHTPIVELGGEEFTKVKRRQFRGLPLYEGMDVIVSAIISISKSNFRTMTKVIESSDIETKSGLLLYREFLNPTCILYEGFELKPRIRVVDVFFRLGEENIILRVSVDSESMESATGDDIVDEAEKLLTAFINSGFRVNTKDGNPESFK